VDVAELSRLLGISVRTIWRLSALAEAGRGDGFPKPVTIGPRLRRWRLDDVRRYLDGLSTGGRP
jgi:predicted DNA-binding transcriptional regulator AlpA